MTRPTKSARGVTVDFDLLKIKSQIAAAPKTVEVKKREDFVDKKLHRRLKKIKRDAESLEEKVEDNLEEDENKEESADDSSST